VNVVVGGVGLPGLQGLAGADQVTFVGLDQRALLRGIEAGADAAVVVSPSPVRGRECQDLAFALVGLRPREIVTIAHPSVPPSAVDLIRWSKCGYRLRSAVRGDVTLPLAAGAVSPAHARRAVIEYVGESSDDFPASAALAVSELVSNALQHAADGLLQLQLFTGGVHISVVDHHPDRWPSLGHADELDDAGRGLGIVASVSAAWGISAVDDAKSVWCEVTRSRRRVGTRTGSAFSGR
jgi:anti-sigma regulatory factor (Ser/Thr protein kinase)